jgi:hypothetical protein
MASLHQRTLSGTKQQIDLEHINRSFDQDQQVAVCVAAEDRRIQTGLFQGQKIEDMHLEGN